MLFSSTNPVLAVPAYDCWGLAGQKQRLVSSFFVTVIVMINKKWLFNAAAIAPA